jgi:chemotaxis protein methyltransferase CheR
MSDADFDAFSRIIHAQTGIVINESKRTMLVSRLSRRLRKLGLSDFRAYRQHLEASDAADERRELISAITTNVTSFFREPAHFEALAAIVPSFAQKASRGDRVRIWSAGCSSGEEPYSIAMTLVERWPEIDRADIRILATDIDPVMVRRARSGRYSRPQNAEDMTPQMKRHVRLEGPDAVTVDPDLKVMIRFEELNLLSVWPFTGMFDVIFCRNVVIYFDAPTRLGLWRRFAERLLPGGVLFVGHSERVDADLEPFLQPCGVTQYRRTSTPIPDSFAERPHV